jgi:two-component system chemotaxis sensor kinase CheA
MDDMTKYRELFFEESDEYIQTLNDCLLELEKNPEEKNIIDEIFRAAHTLKGMAATMGYKTMTELTHHMENVFSLFKNGTVAVSSDIISLLFECLDKLLEIIEDLRVEKYIEYDIDDLLKVLDGIGKDDTKIHDIKKVNERSER